MKKVVNPFVLQAFRGKKYFCNRLEEIQSLHNHVQNGRNIVLFSWRRMGKTALIKGFFEEVEEEKETETIFVDLLPTQDMAGAIKAITIAIYEKFGKTQSGLSATLQRLLAMVGATLSFDPFSGNPEISLGLRKPEFNVQSLQVLGEFLRDRKKNIILALDEFQQVIYYPGQEAEAQFRSWVEDFPEIRFIFSGSHRGMMQAMFVEKNRPFYQSAQLMALDSIPLESYSSFIKKHFNQNQKTIKNSLIEKIYEWSRGQTYTVQLICNHLYSQFDQVKEEALNTVIYQILDQHQSIFSNFPKLLTHVQWQLLKSIAKAEPLKNPTGKDFIQTYQLGAASTVSTALKALEQKELVIRDGDHYLVHDVLLARWMQRL
ncbi:AAA family ATPase [Pararhodonellum marinum]|uniref:AAA family ATPase n=1 Tax=Pararhodonellum marinum TaxID=2755358 RepID=UPI00188F5DE3|nr:ATP-binding protein [Pararhodonellum marinum]